MNITLLGLTSESPPNSARSGSRGKSTATAEYRSDSVGGESAKKQNNRGVSNMEGEGGGVTMLRSGLTKTANSIVRRRPVMSTLINQPGSMGSDRANGRAGAGGSTLVPSSGEFSARNDGKINMKLNDDATINIGGTSYRLSSLLDK